MWSLVVLCDDASVAQLGSPKRCQTAPFFFLLLLSARVSRTGTSDIHHGDSVCVALDHLVVPFSFSPSDMDITSCSVFERKSREESPSVTPLGLSEASSSSLSLLGQLFFFSLISAARAPREKTKKKSSHDAVVYVSPLSETHQEQQTGQTSISTLLLLLLLYSVIPPHFSFVLFFSLLDNTSTLVVYVRLSLSLSFFVCTLPVNPPSDHKTNKQIHPSKKRLGLPRIQKRPNRVWVFCFFDFIRLPFLNRCSVYSVPFPL